VINSAEDRYITRPYVYATNIRWPTSGVAPLPYSRASVYV